MLAIAMVVKSEKLGDPARELLTRCKRGDPEAFRMFVHQYRSAVFSLLSRVLGKGHPQLEDLEQEVFLRAYRAFPRFRLDHEARTSTWLLTIATRLAFNELRRRAFEAVQLDASVELRDLRTPEVERSRRELGRAIEAAAATLSDDQRAAFALAEFHGWSSAEIAHALQISENTVKTRLFRARARMRLLLAPWSSGAI